MYIYNIIYMLYVVGVKFVFDMAKDGGGDWVDDRSFYQGNKIVEYIDGINKR